MSSFQCCRILVILDLIEALSLSLMSLGLKNCKHHPGSDSGATAVAIWVKKKIYGLGKTAQIPPISSTLLIPDDTANFHNCLGKQSLAGHRLSSAISVKQFPVLISKSHILCCVKSIVKVLHVPWRPCSS